MADEEPSTVTSEVAIGSIVICIAIIL